MIFGGISVIEIVAVIVDVLLLLFHFPYMLQPLARPESKYTTIAESRSVQRRICGFNIYIYIIGTVHLYICVSFIKGIYFYSFDLNL